MANSQLIDLANLDPEALDRLANDEGRKFAQSIKVSQIRNLYSAVVKIRNEYQQTDRPRRKEDDDRILNVRRSLVFLKPKLAYAAGRNREVRPFSELMSEAIDGVLNSHQFDQALRNFFALAEALVAYHKFHGAKE